MKTPVESLVHRAARRHRLVSSLQQSSLAALAVLAGLILLLLLGTQILRWPWLLLLALAGLTIAFLRVRRSLLSDYRVAQLVDRQTASHDQLSTAWYLLQHPPAAATGIAAAQIAGAQRIAPGIEPRRIFPVVWQRSWTLVCALAAVAFGLFALRYLVTRSLDFRASLLPMPPFSPVVALERFENLFSPVRVPPIAPSDLAKLNPTATDLPRDREASSEQANKASTASQPAQSMPQTPGAATPGSSKSKRSPDGPASPSTSADPHPQQGAPKEEGEHAKSDPSKEQAAPQSLTDRMRDAMSGLMEKMRPESNPSANKQQNGQQAPNRNGASEDRHSQASENAQRSQQNAQQADRDQNGAQVAGQPQATEKASAPQGQRTAQGSSQKSGDAQSGIGRQDGDKKLQEAAQLRAMGKLDEIIGKRSAQLTGDMTIQTRNSHQQLQTQYSGRVSRHSDSGGLIGHDEVPLALQGYVRGYMEQVHKAANEPH